MSKWLTKSDYLKFLIHPAYLWLVKYAKDTLPPLTESDQLMMQQGHNVETVARQLFPEGILASGDFRANLAHTTELLRGSAPVIFQPAIMTERQLYARSDILKHTVDRWDLYEVKSSARVKFDHINDLAFQKIVWEEAGYTIGRCKVVHINSQYERRGELDPTQLFVVRDVTKQVEALLTPTREQIERALEVLAAPYCPPDGPELASNLYAWLGVYRHLHPELPTESILNLTRLQLDQVKRLGEAGIVRMADIPSGFNLKPQQRRQVELLKLGRRSVHAGRIAHELAKLEYPIYFLDYETVGPALPLWDGTRPYKPLPFQYSLHILPSPGAALQQREYLATGGDYPALGLVEQLTQDLGPQGSVVVWYQEFEAGVNAYLADLHPQFATFLHGVNARIFDLMTIFSDGWYAHPDFFGSASIKKVLPVVVPEMNYKELAIQQGDVASNKWLLAATGKLAPDEAAEVYADLKVYCGQDTLAMVRIYEHLLELGSVVPKNNTTV